MLPSPLFRLLSILLPAVVVPLGAFPLRGADLLTDSTTAVVINVRDLGAIGDGQVHPVSEWLSSGKFANMRALRRVYPFVDDEKWTIDEVAFEQAKLDLPASGGTLYFPAGHYVAGRHGWRIFRDNVRLLGDGQDRTILATAPDVAEGLVLSPYRHVGWMESATRAFPYSADSGSLGDDGVQLVEAERTKEFSPGELVFIRNGASRFDQDYGEFNEIDSVTADGRVNFKYPLSRDYTLTRFNWANEVARDFKLPRAGRTVTVEVRSGEGYFRPSAGTTITLGENIFRVKSAKGTSLRLENTGPGNEPEDTMILAGTKIGKARSLIKLTRSSRNFRCERLQIVGRRKVVNLSNSYDAAFSDCTFRRDLRDGKFSGGLTIDGDGGRFARFDRCTIIAEPAAGMQFARSFGNVVFADCRFTDANVAFTEFNFNCEVTGSTFEVTGTRHLTNVVVAGKSCGDLRFLNNRIHATSVERIFDTYSDIHSQKHGSEGDVVVQGNTIETQKGVHVFTFPRAKHVTVENNTVVQF